MPRTILFVSGFSPSFRARDLAWEFERYGRLVRCDVPALKTPSATPYAFVEFRDSRDAEDAYHYMHRKRIDGYEISVQWAKKAPARSWRFEPSDAGRNAASRRHRDDRRSDDRDRDGRDGRSATNRQRSVSPVRGGGKADREDDSSNDREGRNTDVYMQSRDESPSGSRSMARSSAAGKEEAEPKAMSEDPKPDDADAGRTPSDSGRPE